jgi:hypothetical protein
MKTELSTRDRARQATAAARGAPRAGQRRDPRAAGQNAPDGRATPDTRAGQEPRGARDARSARDARTPEARPARTASAARRGRLTRPGRLASPARPAAGGAPAPAARPAPDAAPAAARPRRPAAGGADTRTVPRRSRTGRAATARAGSAGAGSTVAEPLRRPARGTRPAPSRPGGGVPAGPAAAARATAEAARRAAAARRLGGSRTPFVLLVLGLLGGGLVCLLVINTTLSAASYQINTLQQGNAQLSQQAQALQQQIAREQAPATIAKRAAALGMRPEQRLNFVNARTGQISTQPATLPGVPNVPGFTP